VKQEMDLNRSILNHTLKSRQYCAIRIPLISSYNDDFRVNELTIKAGFFWDQLLLFWPYVLI